MDFLSFIQNNCKYAIEVTIFSSQFSSMTTLKIRLPQLELASSLSTLLHVGNAVALLLTPKQDGERARAQSGRAPCLGKGNALAGDLIQFAAFS